MKKLLFSAGLALLVIALSSAAAQATGNPHLRTYQITLENLTGGQPFSPPVAATHRHGIEVFDVGSRASPELELIAEDGNEVPMFERLMMSKKVTEALDIGRPLTPHGTTVGDFTDSVTFQIEARPGDRFSLATMLICTNDGITGLDGIHLPHHGERVFYLGGYDAGTEDNTEASQDIVDPCSALGPAPLDGDPDGNEDSAVDTHPQRRVRHHPGIAGLDDLDPELHGWKGPVARVTIERVD
ncbi:MAG: spondin domain-containing protein [Dehalococcoidia bacterium]